MRAFDLTGGWSREDDNETECLEEEDLCRGVVSVARHALPPVARRDVEVDEGLPPTERPTIPVPRESDVRLRVSRRALAFATVDIVMCDLARDPRSEDYVGDRPPVRASGIVAVTSDRQNDKPPSTSTVRALK